MSTGGWSTPPYRHRWNRWTGVQLSPQHHLALPQPPRDTAQADSPDSYLYGGYYLPPRAAPGAPAAYYPMPTPYTQVTGVPHGSEVAQAVHHGSQVVSQADYSDEGKLGQRKQALLRYLPPESQLQVEASYEQHAHAHLYPSSAYHVYGDVLEGGDYKRYEVAGQCPGLEHHQQHAAAHDQPGTQVPGYTSVIVDSRQCQVANGFVH